MPASPESALARLRRLRPSPAHLLVLVAALFVAAPFLTSRALGTREAYNYSLTVADAVTQFRAGEIPMLAGQTEYAFNGRIHPLRTAPALAYAASLLDLVTFRQLGFWTLQNLVLAFALIGGAGSCYWALRALAGSSAPLASALAAAFVLSPPVLAAAYGMDLYMTVLTAPFVPLIIGANVQVLAGRRFPATYLAATALAGCWLAHPPIALWLTATTVILQGVALLRHPPSRADWCRLLGALALFTALSGYSFISALSIAPLDSVNRRYEIAPLFVEVQRTFAGTFRPISAHANELSDFQVGYAYWAMAVVAAGFAIVRRQWTALVLLGVAGFLYLFVAPVPVVHRWLWTQAPAVVINLTNQWPMQRLYLPIITLLLFAFALAWRSPGKAGGRLASDAFRLVLAAAIGWTLWQAGHFVSRGFATRQTAVATARSHLSSNLDLTPISYALLGTPTDFTNGVMDPAFSFRLLAPFDAQPLLSNWSARPPASRTLSLVAKPGETDDILDLGEPLTLEPGRRYRLDFDFKAAPTDGTFQIRGQSLYREYPLPSAGGPRAFGMKSGNNPALTLWTDQSTAEIVRFRLVGPAIARSPLRGKPFAEVSLSVVDPASLPIQLEGLMPLRVRLAAPRAGYLETPRSFIPGYVAAVDGRPVRVQRSPDGLAMLAVPAGSSQVELEYRGTPLLRASFWVAAVGWILAAGCAIGQRAPGPWRQALAASAARSASRARELLRSRRLLIGLAAGLLLVGGIASWTAWRDRAQASGPIRIRFVLPQGETGRQQPLLVTGRPHAGLFIYVRYADAQHVRIGVDSWGVLGFQTEPIKTDYFADHELVVDAGSLYPDGRPRAPDHLRIDFDGVTVFDQDVVTYPSDPHEVTVGENRIGGSSCEPRFAGKILAVERLPASLARR